MFYQNYIVDVRPKQLKLGQKVQKLVFPFLAHELRKAHLLVQ